MKKTLAAIIVSAVAVSGANAFVVYQDDSTTVDLNGSLRLQIENTNKGSSEKGSSHTSFQNAGSRIKLDVKHNLTSDVYALGRTEIRFDGGKDTDNGIGDLNVRKVIAGFGVKHSDSATSEIAFGKYTTIIDDLGFGDGYDLWVMPDYLPSQVDGTLRYDYYLGTDSQDLNLTAQYIFAQDHDSTSTTNDVVTGGLKSGAIVGALYSVDAGPGSFLFHGAVGRTSHKVDAGDSGSSTAFQVSLGYAYEGYSLFVDGGYFDAKNIPLTGYAEGVYYAGDSEGYFVSPGFNAPLVRENGKTVSKLYGNYVYEQQKGTDSVSDDTGAVTVTKLKTKRQGFLLGVDYKLHKQVITYLEGNYTQTKEYTDNSLVTESSDKGVAIGLRVYF